MKTSSVIALLFASSAMAKVWKFAELQKELGRICEGKKIGDPCVWDYSEAIRAYHFRGTVIQTCKTTTVCNCRNRAYECTPENSEYPTANGLQCQLPPRNTCRETNVRGIVPEDLPADYPVPA